MFDDGRAGRDAGMRQALDHAESESPRWGDRALDVLRAYMIGVSDPFIAPWVRAWAVEHTDLPPPPTAMAWGAVFARAARAGLIRPAGYCQYGDATMHTQTVSKWVAV